MSKSRPSKQKAKKLNQPASQHSSKSSPASPTAPQWFGQGFVGYQNGVSKEQLQALLNQLQSLQLSSEESQTPATLTTPAYFLKWIHCVSGMVNNLENLPAAFPSPEGQMFTDKISLRWQQCGDRYNVLVLSSEPLEHLQDFQPITNCDCPVIWETRLLSALPHEEKTPQYPNRFIYQGISKDQICQRYFRDTQTGTVHFVALALNNHD
jgi:hypothetical protein